MSQVRAAVVLVLLGIPSVGAAAPFRPFPQHVTLAAGALRPSHRTQAQLDADVATLYDAWKSRYLAQARTEPGGHPRYRVLRSRSSTAKTVSEGMGFGMVIVPLLAGHDPDAQTIFDGLWEYARDHRSPIDPRLMDFSVDANEVADSSGNASAFDGDCDIALGLLLAQAQWGNGGRFDYGAEAQWVIGGILGSTIGPASRLPLLGDWVDPDGTPYSQWTTRTSDFMLSNFRAFATATSDPVWDQVIASTQAAVRRIQTVYSPSTGLLPDFLEPVSPSDHAVRPADPGFFEGSHDGDYGYNAVRDPFRLGLDAVLSGDPTSRDQVRNSAWALNATAGEPQLVKATRRLDGSLVPGAGYFTTIFAATLGVAAMSMPGQQQWLNAVYDAVRLSDEDYYEDTVTLLSLLAMTGNFWVPTAPPPVCGNGVAEAGEVCDDGNLADGDGCDSNCTPTGCGNGIRTAGEACDDGNQLASDCCSPGCQLEATGAPCDDGDPCSAGDACAAGVCAGTLAPAAGCMGAPGGRLTLTEGTKRQLAWTWSHGTAAPAEVGDSLSGGTSYAVCVFDAAGGNPVLRVRAHVSPGGTCGRRSCWSVKAGSFRYRNAVETPGELRDLKLTPGGGTARITLHAKGAALSALGLPLAQDPAVTVQLKASTGACWEARYTPPASRNDATRFTDSPQ